MNDNGSATREEIEDLRVIPFSDITPNTDQPRKYFDQDSLEKLAGSIAEVGILNPIQVKPMAAGRFKIIDGERRFHAAKMAGLDRADCIVREVNSAKVFELSVVANFAREEMKPMEIAVAIKRMMDEGRNTKEVARMIGRSQGYVTNMLKLIHASPALAGMLARREITPGVAKLCASYPVDDQARLAKAVTKRLEGTSYDAKVLGRVVKQEAEDRGLTKVKRGRRKRRQRSSTELLVREVSSKAKKLNDSLEDLLEADEEVVLNVPGGTLLDLPIHVQKTLRLVRRANELCEKI